MEAESTAWATQLQLLTGKLLVRISDNVGRGVVKSRKGKPTDGSADLALARQLEPGIFDEIKKLGIE